MAALGVVEGATTLEKIESFINDPMYKEILENSLNYNTRLCIERRMRLPFIDTQTGVAQNHSQLFMHRRQRIPGLVPGQIYCYPRPRWRKKRRQYLSATSRPYMRIADHMNPTTEGEGEMHAISQVENPALQDTDSKDSQLLLKDEKEWFYDDQDMLEMDTYEEPDPDSDIDFEETFSKRSRHRRRNNARNRNSDSPGSSSRKRNNNSRGRKKAAHNFDPTPGDPDKPFACERPTNKRNRHNHSHAVGNTPGGMQSSNTLSPHPTTPFSPINQGAHSSSIAQSLHHGGASNVLPPTLPPNLSPAQQQINSNLQDDPPMPVLMPEKMDAIIPAHHSSSPNQSPHIPNTQEPQLMNHTVTHSANQQQHQTATHKPSGAQPSPYCDFCLGDSTQNKKTGGVEDLVSCSDCGRSGHPSCLLFTDNMKISVKKYSWQCIECKCCSVCGTSDNDDQLLFCDDCDRGYHMYCLTPPLTDPPEGSWSCQLCIEQFH